MEKEKQPIAPITVCSQVFISPSPGCGGRVIRFNEAGDKVLIRLDPLSFAMCASAKRTVWVKLHYLRQMI